MTEEKKSNALLEVIRQHTDPIFERIAKLEREKAELLETMKLFVPKDSPYWEQWK
jgi:peptide subunit release factor RF-3